MASSKGNFRENDKTSGKNRNAFRGKVLLLYKEGILEKTKRGKTRAFYRLTRPGKKIRVGSFRKAYRT